MVIESCFKLTVKVLKKKEKKKYCQENRMSLNVDDKKLSATPKSFLIFKIEYFSPVLLSLCLLVALSNNKNTKMTREMVCLWKLNFSLY